MVGTFSSTKAGGASPATTRAKSTVSVRARLGLVAAHRESAGRRAATNRVGAAARAAGGRLGVGGVEHLAAVLRWLAR